MREDSIYLEVSFNRIVIPQCPTHIFAVYKMLNFHSNQISVQYDNPIRSDFPNNIEIYILK